MNDNPSINSEYIDSRFSNPAMGMRKRTAKPKTEVDPNFKQAISKYIKQPGRERKKSGGFR